MTAPSLLVAALFLQTGATAPAASRPRDSWFGADKVKHFFTSAFVQSVAYSSARAAGVGHGGSLAAASAVTGVAGVLKERHDRRSYGLFSVRDLAWDAAGAGAATLILVRTVR